MKSIVSKVATLVFVAGLGVPTYAAEVDTREANQQARIAQGVRSGQLTPGETAHLEHKEAGIHREIKQERAANGGHLTAGERAQVNRQQNRVSGQIYRAKHNSRKM